MPGKSRTILSEVPAIPGYLNGSVARITKGQKGFTLIEMIVVMGIIAVLAAVIVAKIGKFIGTGKQGDKDAEWELVRMAMHAMMSDAAATTVTALVRNSRATWDAMPVAVATDPGAVPLFGAAVANQHIQSNPTAYFYCYDGNGQITRQDEVATACWQPVNTSTVAGPTSCVCGHT